MHATTVPALDSVLTVCAHPDDESFGLGALLVAFAAAGNRTSVLCFTHGEASTLHGVAGDLAAVRVRELAAASAHLGVAWVRLLDYPDGSLPAQPLEQLTADVTRAARELDVDGFLVFDDGGVTGHPDHQRATDAALGAAAALDLPVMAWALPLDVAQRLNQEFGTNYVGRTRARPRPQRRPVPPARRHRLSPQPVARQRRSAPSPGTAREHGVVALSPEPAPGQRGPLTFQGLAGRTVGRGSPRLWVPLGRARGHRFRIWNPSPRARVGGTECLGSPPRRVRRVRRGAVAEDSRGHKGTYGPAHADGASRMLSTMAMPFSPFHRRGRAVEGEDPRPLIPPTLTHRPVDELGKFVADEVEAILAGRLVEHLLARGRAVPAWAVLNKLAHATVEDLMELAEPDDGAAAGARDGREPGWRRGQRALAAELLAGATTPDEVLSAQWAVLVPLELWLIERSRSETITSRRVLDIAADALAAHRRDP